MKKIVWLLPIILIAIGGIRLIQAQSGPQLTATLDDQLVVDQNGNGLVDAGDTIRYTAIITNCGPDDATDVEYNSNLDPNTSLVPGSVQVLPPQPADPSLCQPGVAPPPASVDAQATDDQVAVANGSSVNQNILTNDQGEAPLQVLSFGDSPATVGTHPADGVTVGSFPAGGGTLDVTIDAAGNLTVTANGTTGSGSVTIFYEIQAGNGTTDTGQITLNFGDFPVAVDDTQATLSSGNEYTVSTAGTLTVSAADPNDLLDNDTLGNPSATLTNWGGGDASAAVNLAPGTAQPFAGGTLTVNADGSFTLNTPTTPGVFTFDYIIDNGISSSQATVEIYVEDPPVAADDAFTASVGQTNTYPAPALFDDNSSGADYLGAPPATITGWGNIDGGSGDPAEFAAGSTQALPAAIGGTLTVNTDGSFEVDSPTDSGTFTFQYTLSNGVAPDSVATVTVDVVAVPVAVDDDLSVILPNNLSGDLTADNGNGPDDPGTPPFTTLTFGGGDLGGSVTDNTATPGGTSVALADGTLTIDDAGVITLNGATTPGQYTFQYQLTNTEGSSAPATVTIDVFSLPVAVDDGATGSAAYTVTAGSTTTAGAAAGVVQTNDAWTLASTPSVYDDALVDFYGDVGAVDGVGDTAAGNAYAIPGSGGVTVTIQTDGSLTLDATAGTVVGGEYQFDYRITNSAGSDTATVTILVQSAPDGFDDTDATVTGGTSVPGSTPFHLAINTSSNGVVNAYDDHGFGADILGVPSAPTDPPADVINNVILAGTPDAGTGSIGGGAITVGGDGSIEITTAGDINITPPTDLAGLLEFDYTLANSIGTDPTPATVTFAFGQRPMANDDAFTATANIEIEIAAPGVFADNGSAADQGDQLGTLTTITLVQGGANVGTPVATANGGTVTLNADGSFDYDPPPGFTGNDTFTYTIDNGFNTPSQATVTIAVSDVAGAVPWFIDNSDTGANLGTFNDPFQSIAAFNAVNNGGGTNPDDNDVIYIFRSTGYNEADGINLDDGQALYGGGIQFDTVFTADANSSAAYQTFAATAAGASTLIASTGGNGIDLATNNIIEGVSVGDTPAANFAFNGTSVSNLTVGQTSTVDVTGTGGALNINGGGTVNATFNTLSSSSSSSAIVLNNITAGTITGTTGAISGATSISIDVNGSGANLTYNGSLAHNNTSTGIDLTSNSGTYTFTGTLNITSGSATAFNATGGGTVNVTGTGNTINTTTGTGVNIVNTTIGASGVTFQSVSVNGATNGIVLDTTGTTGAFTVSGDGSMTGGVLDRDGSGGTITGTICVRLTNAHNVTLRQMDLINCTDHAVESTSGSNHVLSAMTIQNPTNHGWEATNLQGTSRIDNNSLVTQFNGINQDGVRLINTNTDFTSFTVDNVTFSNSATGNDGFFHRTLGTTSGNIVITNSTFTGLDADGVQVANDGSGTIITTIQGNTFTTADNTGGDGNNGLALNLGGTGVHQFTVDNNTFTDVNRLGDNSGIINVTAAGAGTGATSQIVGTIQNNDISNSAGRRGISVLLEASGGSGHGGHTIVIDNNDVNDVAREGIYVGMSSVVGRTNNGNKITITNNNVGDISVVSTAGNREGIEIEAFHDGTGGGSIEADILVQNNVAVINNTDETFRVTNDAFTTAGAASTTLDVTIWGNVFTNNNGSGDSFEHRNWDAGSTSCLDINAANEALDRNNSNQGYLIARSGGTFGIEGLAAGTYTDAQVNTFVDARNDGGGSAANGGNFTGSVTCSLP